MYPVSKRQSSAYDRVSTMFSPDGRLYQVEYAAKIVEQGTVGAGLVYKDGVMFGADKQIQSRLVLPDSIEKLFKIDDHIAAISSGLVGDARRLVQLARKECQENQMWYEEKIQVETLVKRISGIKQLFTQYAGMRPFGVSFIIGGVDESGKRLFETEPSGALAEYKAIAIGRGKKESMKVFEKDYKDDMGFDDALKLMVLALEKGQSEKEKLDLNRVDLAYIEPGKKLERISKQMLKTSLGKTKTDVK